MVSYPFSEERFFDATSGKDELSRVGGSRISFGEESILRLSRTYSTSQRRAWNNRSECRGPSPRARACFIHHPTQKRVEKQERKHRRRSRRSPTNALRSFPKLMRVSTELSDSTIGSYWRPSPSLSKITIYHWRQMRRDSSACVGFV